MSKLNLTIATGNYDRTRPISDGRVDIEGVDLNHLFFSRRRCFIVPFGSNRLMCASSRFRPIVSAPVIPTSYIAVPRSFSQELQARGDLHTPTTQILVS